MKQEKKWNMMYSLLVEYYNKYGDSNVTMRFKTINGYEYDDNGLLLGRWVGMQRQLYAKNQLKSDRIKKLQLLNFVFETKKLEKGVFELRWDYVYSLLLEYYNKYGNSNVPQTFKTNNGYDYSKDGISLGMWVNYQRHLYKNNCLEEEKIKKLLKVDFIIELDDYKWDYMYGLLISYYNKYGNTNVPVYYKTLNEEKLGKWVYTQRHVYKINKLSEERRKKLLKVNFVFDNEIDNIENICLHHHICYEKYKSILDRLSYSDFISRLYYLLDNYMDVVDDNGNLNIIFGMDNDTLYLFTDFTSDELKSYYNKKYMMELIDSYYERVENKTPIRIKRR